MLRKIYTSFDTSTVLNIVRYILQDLGTALEKVAPQDFVNPLDFKTVLWKETFLDDIVITDDIVFAGVANQASCSCCTFAAAQRLAEYCDIVTHTTGNSAIYEMCYRIVEMYYVNGDKLLQEKLLKSAKTFLHIPALDISDCKTVKDVFVKFYDKGVKA